MTDELVEKNKVALLQEMGSSINESVSALNLAISTPTENHEDKIALLYSSMMLLSQNIGYLAACFNQYMIFVNGELPDDDDKVIGFKSLSGDE